MCVCVCVMSAAHFSVASKNRCSEVQNSAGPQGNAKQRGGFCLNSLQMIFFCGGDEAAASSSTARLSDWRATSRRSFDQQISGIMFITRDGAPPQCVPQMNLRDKSLPSGSAPPSFIFLLLFLLVSSSPLLLKFLRYSSIRSLNHKQESI